MVWDPSPYHGQTWNSNASGGHAVLCVSYDDTDSNNRYWILVNSRGTADGSRPHGIFRMKMDVDYSATYLWTVQSTRDAMGDRVSDIQRYPADHGHHTIPTTIPTITVTPMPTYTITTMPTTIPTAIVTPTITTGPDTPTFAGIWETTYGQMKLTVAGRQVHGTYGYWGEETGTIGGTLYDSGQTLYGT
ncbi:C1 family peptidase [Methanosphaerula palustris]|uniref:hypothetical protein n=1 Tax=Methanosphaerula palustris TaxID=475088 RepID=UPI00018486B1|nr:hypothetical protein [Methanosphaerula palustris]